MDTSVDPFHIGIQHISNTINAVDRLVDENTAALFVPCSLPVTSAVIVERTVPGQIGTCGKDFSEITPLDHFAELFHTFCVTCLEDNAQLYMSFFGGTDHSVCILKTGGNGLFGKDVNAGFHGFDGHDRMQEMRQTEMYHINILIQDLIKVRSPGTVKFLCKGFGKSWIFVNGIY